MRSDRVDLSFRSRQVRAERLRSAEGVVVVNCPGWELRAAHNTSNQLAALSHHPSVIIAVTNRTRAALPPFAFMASSESVLEGKRNLFQLCCIVDSIEPKRTGEGSMSMSSLDGNLGAIKGREILGAMNALGGFAAKKVGQIDPKDITPVVSTPFVVASRRLKKASKSNIPFVTDSLLKLKHMGANAVDKLGNIGMLIDSLPKALGKVTNVGQFKGLIQLANNDKQLRNQLLGLLKLNQTKWEDVSEQVLRCVHKDNRVRVWCPEDIERDGLRVGFLFGCDCGCPDLTIPIGVYSVTGASSLNMTSTLPEARRYALNEPLPPIHNRCITPPSPTLSLPYFIIRGT